MRESFSGLVHHMQGLKSDLASCSVARERETLFVAPRSMVMIVGVFVYHLRSRGLQFRAPLT